MELDTVLKMFPQLLSWKNDVDAFIVQFKGVNPLTTDPNVVRDVIARVEKLEAMLPEIQKVVNEIQPLLADISQLKQAQ